MLRTVLSLRCASDALDRHRLREALQAQRCGLHPEALADGSPGGGSGPVAPHWSKLLAASVLPRRAPYADGFLRVRDPSRALAWPDPHCLAELALFVCDFSRLQPRAALPRLPCCTGASARRPRPACGSASDALDCHRLRKALQAQHGGPHPGALAVGSPEVVGAGDD